MKASNFAASAAVSGDVSGVLHVTLFSGPGNAAGKDSILFLRRKITVDVIGVEDG